MSDTHFTHEEGTCELCDWHRRVEAERAEKEHLFRPGRTMEEKIDNIERIVETIRKMVM